MVPVYLTAHGYFRHAVVACDQENGIVIIRSFFVLIDKIPHRIIQEKDTRKLVPVISPLLFYVICKLNLRHSIFKLSKVLILFVDQEWAVCRHGKHYINIWLLNGLLCFKKTPD